ncbi:LOW QUALITY PROTEIN: C2 domain-containing protein 5-like [Ruditapes philippinarum]|uniref:LOW QUALITY PROTEIN: C2 domain-containing protein 5-like n=1 Tax=Ruditapes philippinarum TaxID=129788 RepID=UPI00295A7C74|nr:LOW QUALITY PROTEIN: C2 domain-containing protein 5-like [Ruditapes philippinarum]
MPGKVKVKVVAARGLPVMDRSTDLTDAFVEIKFGSEVQKTEVYKRSLNPQWNSEWFKFEVEDEVLQDEPLELRVLDHDTYSAHDAIGKVYIDLNPLLVKESPSVITGWFPIYDTMHGIRGDLNVLVKIDLFSDFNKFRQSSCGIQFFCTAEVPSGYRLQYVHGFVEELVVNDDPEYQWIDKIRTPRSSNEARQRLFSKMSGQLARKIGLKVLEMGGSAVIGYKQCFDLEGESGIVIRGIGTAVTLAKLRDPQVSPLGASPLKDYQRPIVPALYISMPLVITSNTQSHAHRRSLHLPHSHPLTPVPSNTLTSNSHSTKMSTSVAHTVENNSTPSSPRQRSLTISHTHPLTAPPMSKSSPSDHSSERSHFAFDFTYSSPVPEENLAPSSPPVSHARSTTSPMKVTGPPSGPPNNRRSSDSDMSTPPKGSSLAGSSGSGSGSGTKNFPKPCSQQINIELMEYPLFTMTSFPPGFIIHIGGVVAARSIKLLDKIHNPEEPETRDAWWNEVRTEIRSHTRAMGCHAVIGYCELTSICDELILLSATGTAAKVNLNLDQYLQPKANSQQLVSAGDRNLATEKERDQGKKLFVDVNLANQMTLRSGGSSEDGSPRFACSLCHIPYKPSSAPFPINLSQCACCRYVHVVYLKFNKDFWFLMIPIFPLEHVVFGMCFSPCFYYIFPLFLLHFFLFLYRVIRPKINSKAEANAKEISDILPFLEYDLHNQLMNKLKMRSMNGLFGLKMQFVVGESMLIGIASATGAYLVPLPPPPVPRLLGQITSEEENVALLDLQKKLAEQIQRNKDLYQLTGIDFSGQPSPHSVYTDDSDDEGSDLELSAGNKDTFVLEVDDTKDDNIQAMLHDTPHPAGMDLCNTETCPGIQSRLFSHNLQMFTQVYRRKIDLEQHMKTDFKEFFDGVYRRLFFKLRRMIPCCLCNLVFSVDAPEEDEIEVVVTGTCVAIDDSQPQSKAVTDTPVSSSASNKQLLKSANVSVVGASGENVDDMMFQMEEVTEGSASSALHKVPKIKAEVLKKKQSQVFGRTLQGIQITPLAYVPGAKIEKYIGSYNFFFIRETTSVREVGGVCGFMQKFIMEVLAIVRAHVSSLGGNALVAYNLTQCVLLTNEHKNQSQCLINVCGDAVHAVKEGEITAVIPEHVRKHSDSPIYVTT